MERGKLGRGGELTREKAEKRVNIKQRERENEREIMRNDSHGGREGGFNYGMFHLITNSNNYLQLLCTFSFHACNYYVIMWIIHFGLNTWIVAKNGRSEAKENSRKQRKSKVRDRKWMEFSRGRRTVVDFVLSSRLISHWPSVLGDRRSAANPIQQT